ncbi:MAG: GAF domain-containing protein [Muribaculaceae bacterium]|nr:GAF domain-containing protein [Muribaculaceae bacterium]
MAEHLEVSQGSKKEKYELLLKQIGLQIENEKDTIAVMANVASMIHETFGYLWTGFYLVKGDCLVLGPFQGPLACTRIKYGKGVCGTAWKEGRDIVVDDVDKFPGHIACSSKSKSEIVVPIKRGEEICGVIDIDSEKIAAFDETDLIFLREITDAISDTFNPSESNSF